MEKQIDMFGNEHSLGDVQGNGVTMQKKYGVLLQWKCSDCDYCFRIRQEGRFKHTCIVSRVQNGEVEDITPNDKACRKFSKRR